MGEKSSYINIEDVLFSAILGAYLGTFINNLEEFSIFSLVAFFVIFPVTLKYIEDKSKYALAITNAIGILLFYILLRILIANNMITDKENAGMLIIFIGWIISINSRSIVLLFQSTKKENFDLKMESIAIDKIKAIIFLVSDYQSRVQNDNDFDLHKSMLYQVMETLKTNHNNIEFIWLVHEDIAEKKGSSSYIAREIKDLYNGHFVIKKETIENPFETKSTFIAIKRIYDEALKVYKLKEQEIICDSTGGTKPMSIGASIACSSSRKLVYCTMDGGNAWKFIQVNKTILKKDL